MNNFNFHVIEKDILDLPNGDALKLKTYHLKSNRLGSKIYIQSSMHGAEVQGQAVIYELLEYFFNHSFNGEIFFTPVANPLALNYKTGTFTQGRFNPITGDNWNRLYIDLTKHIDVHNFAKNHINHDAETIKKNFKQEMLLALNELKKSPDFNINQNKKLHITLQEITSQCDIILDLHTGPRATRYLYAPEYLKNHAHDLCFSHHLIIPHEFAGACDEATFVPWITLSDQFNTLGRSINPHEFIEAYTLELGNEETISFKDAKTDSMRILYFLSKRGIVNQEIKKIQTKTHACKLKDFKTIYAQTSGVCEFLVSPGDKVYKGDILARILNFTPLKQGASDLSKTVLEIRAEYEMIIINHFPSAIISQGVELFQVMTNFTNLK